MALGLAPLSQNPIHNSYSCLQIHLLAFGTASLHLQKGKMQCNKYFLDCLFQCAFRKRTSIFTAPSRKVKELNAYSFVFKFNKITSLMNEGLINWIFRYEETGKVYQAWYLLLTFEHSSLTQIQVPNMLVTIEYNHLPRMSLYASLQELHEMKLHANRFVSRFIQILGTPV